MSDMPFRRPKRKIFPKIITAIIVILIIAGGFAYWKINSLGSKIFGSQTSFLQQAANVVTKNESAAKLLGEDSGQINILLLGYGGAGHDGPYLTDSIILASIRPNDKKILLTSIPRDYYYASTGGEKINAVFPANVGSQVISNQAIEKGGSAAEYAISTISGQTIPYFVSIDFQGFIDAVNRVGGMQVNVPNTFTDTQYPNGEKNVNGPYCAAQPGDTASKCRYLALHFTAGLQTMNGATALQFARSRHSLGVEGSDFARSKRQQIVLQAFKDKIEKLNLFSNAGAVNDLATILSDHLHTTMTIAQAKHLADIVRQPGMQTLSQSLDPSTGLVCNAKTAESGADVVQPCDGVSTTAIAQFFQNGFQSSSSFRLEQSTVILENYNNADGTYGKIKKALTDGGATVYDVNYHGKAITKTTIYYVKDKPLTRSFLEQQLGVTAQPLPSTMTAKADLVVILAKDTSFSK
jgi:LCP family protein required for cell wall assembly